MGFFNSGQLRRLRESEEGTPLVDARGLTLENAPVLATSNDEPGEVEPGRASMDNAEVERLIHDEQGAIQNAEYNQQQETTPAFVDDESTLESETHTRRSKRSR